MHVSSCPCTYHGNDSFLLQASSARMSQEVRRILADVRAQYDQVHLEAERREVGVSGLSRHQRKCKSCRLRSPHFGSRSGLQIEITAMGPTSHPRRRIQQRQECKSLSALRLAGLIPIDRTAMV